jgi:cytochrome c peroxidase
MGPLARSRTMTRVIAITLVLIAGAAGVSAQRGQGGRPPAPPPDAPPQGPGRGGPGRGGPGGPDGLGGLNVTAANPLTPQKIEAGRKLFFDTRLSADNSTSCATCHDPSKAFADGRAIARGVHNAVGSRNTPSLVNAGFGRAFFWDGRATTLEAQVLGPMTNPNEMGLSEPEIEERTNMKAADVAAALASYVRTIRSRDSRYDYFRAGQTEMLTADERAGLDVFRGRQCVTCHGGPNLTDERFHNTGVGWTNGRFADAGRVVVTNDERDRGAFKTPSLRDVARTAPYMHDGSLSTLEEVVAFYSQGGRRNPNQDPRMRPLNLSVDEQRALVAFLKTLNGKITEGGH